MLLCVGSSSSSVVLESASSAKAPNRLFTSRFSTSRFLALSVPETVASSVSKLPLSTLPLTVACLADRFSLLTSPSNSAFPSLSMEATVSSLSFCTLNFEFLTIKSPNREVLLSSVLNSAVFSPSELLITSFELLVSIFSVSTTGLVILFVASKSFVLVLSATIFWAIKLVVSSNPTFAFPIAAFAKFAMRSTGFPSSSRTS